MTYRTLLIVALLLATSCSSKEPYVQPESQEPLVAPTQTTGATEAPEPVDENTPTTVDLSSVDPTTLDAIAPERFVVKFATTEGDFEVQINREWAPKGVDRFYNLVQAGYYTDIAAFRVIDGFMAQFGIHGDPAVNEVWREAKIMDDERVPGVSNTRGTMTFAMAGPNTRTTQLYINFGDNKMLDSQGFHPIGEVMGDGMSVVDAWHSGYGEGAPMGQGPDQRRIQAEGNQYLADEFSELSYIKSITLQ